MNRRRFAFWIGFGLFWASNKARAHLLDSAAAGVMRWSESQQPLRVRWQPNQNRKWRWFERETKLDGKWQTTGITLPTDKATGKPYPRGAGYLKESLVPAHDKARAAALYRKLGQAQADPARRAAHGRPPSEWLRSLRADELRIWLRTIDVPQVGVGGMTTWTHLTRDHSFDAARIEGLTESEQTKLHSAAHFGY